MKFTGLVSLFVCSILFCSVRAHAQDMDKEIAGIAEKLALQIKESGKSKVTVLDFSDLQGNTTELGRFVAEELSVALVERRTGFAVMDRANLKKILAELKLTADGLVEPENAKKLGQLSGVDAIILGNITPLEDGVAITVKIIATDTAEIVGATRARITKSKEVAALLENAIANGASANGTDKPKAKEPAPLSQTFGSLNIVLENLRALDNRTVLISLRFQNRSERNPIAVAIYCETSYSDESLLRSSLLGSDGTQFYSYNYWLTGIRGIRQNPKNLTEIPPGGEIRTSFKYEAKQSFSILPDSLRLQMEVVMDANYSARAYPPNFQAQQDVLPGNCRIHNLVLDIPVR